MLFYFTINKNKNKLKKPNDMLLSQIQNKCIPELINKFNGSSMPENYIKCACLRKNKLN